MGHRLGPLGSLMAAGVLLLAVNVAASVGLRTWKLDWTEEGLYTLSEGSKALLDTAEDRVKLRFFYSRKAAASLPRVRQYADRIMELLRQYRDAGGGRVALEQLEPRPDTQIEEWALQYGLQPVQRVGEESLYLGLVAVSDAGREEAIPFLSPQREDFLEYDITRLISAVSEDHREVIGILSPLDVFGIEGDPRARLGQASPGRPWALVSELRKQYEVRPVGVDASEIDPDVDLLVVLHPKELTDSTLYAVDQYLLAGGRLLVAVDPLSLVDQQSFPATDFNARFQARFDSDLPVLFRAWGIELVPGMVAADLDLGARVRMGAQVMKHPSILTVGAAQCNQQEIVSADLESLSFGHSGILRILEGAGDSLERTPLVRAGSRSGATDAMMLKIGGDPEQLRRSLEIAEEPVTLAMKVTGTFPTAFPDGAPSSDGETRRAQNHLAESRQPTAVIVLADTDLLSDDFSVRRQSLLGQELVMLLNDNLSLAVNAVEALSGAAELATLRTRGKSARPFTLVERLAREADEKWRGVEEELLQRQQETNRRLRELESGRTEDERSVLSRSQLEEVQRFRDELAATKQRLREVRRNLRQDIEALGFRLKLLNIVLMPVVVLLLGFVPAVWRNVKGRKR